MRRLALLAAAVSALCACSSRSHDGGPTTAPDPALAAAPPVAGDPPPPPRPARPLDDATLDALAAVTIPDHQVTVARRGAADLAAIVTAPGGTRVIVTASACRVCPPAERAAWEARRAELAALWAPNESDGDTLVLAAPVIAGQTVIAVDARRTVDGEHRQTYQLHWSDGISQVAAVCEASAPTAEADVPPAVCAAAAAAALAPYLAVLTAGVTD